MKNQIFVSEDGSHSVRSENFKVSYHSKHGALTESNHVFIDAGLRESMRKLPNKECINVFEMGFGTGLNALLSQAYAEEMKRKVRYVGVEQFPISKTLAAELNFCHLQHLKPFQSSFDQMHNCRNNETIQLSAYFEFQVVHEDIHHIQHDQPYDLIYFDAFGPGTQPVLWEEALHRSLYTILNNNATLVTYCAQGKFKRTLREIGYTVEALPGPPGKREMTRAHKS